MSEVPPSAAPAAVLGQRQLPVPGPGQRELLEPSLVSCSLPDQPSFALSFPTLFSAEELHRDAVGLFRSVTPSRCVQQALQLQFVPRFIFLSSFFLPCGAYSDSTEGGTGNFVFQNQFSRF